MEIAGIWGGVHQICAVLSIKFGSALYLRIELDTMHGGAHMTGDGTRRRTGISRKRKYDSLLEAPITLLPVYTKPELFLPECKDCTYLSSSSYSCSTSFCFSIHRNPN